ncbi:transposase [Collinsella sp. An2]|nr:transposase [Collinsella sp. An2]
MAANADRHPASAQCEILGVPRSTYCYLRPRPEPPPAPDPVEPDVLAVHAGSKGRHGARKVKASLERRGVVASRRRISRVMRENGPSSAYGGKRFKAHPGKPNEAEPPNVLDRSFDGHAPRTHVCSGLAYVRAGGSWCYVCLLVDPCNREIVGHSAGSGKGAELVKAAFATPGFPISDIEVSRTDRGSEFDNAEIDLMLEAFGIERSLSAKGCPHDDAADESTNKMLEAELVYRDSFSDLRDLQAKLSDYVHRHDNFRINPTLGYMSPVEFRKARLILSKPSK